MQINVGHSRKAIIDSYDILTLQQRVNNDKEDCTYLKNMFDQYCNRKTKFFCSYKESAIKTSKLMRSWPRTNVEKAGDVIQYVIDNGGRIPHLKSYAKNLNWFQYHCIDVIAFLFTIVVAFCYTSYKATQLLYLNAMKLSRKIKVQ